MVRDTVGRQSSTLTHVKAHIVVHADDGCDGAQVKGQGVAEGCFVLPHATEQAVRRFVVVYKLVGEKKERKSFGISLLIREVSSGLSLFLLSKGA